MTFLKRIANYSTSVMSLNKISVLKKANHSLEEVNRLSDQLHKSKAAGYHPTRDRSSIKSAAECTKRHQRNLKRRRANSCSDSLLWLGQEGYTPTLLRRI